MNWNDLRFVLTVARFGTLSAAARHLRVDQTTVARRLAATESDVGTRLFDRVDGSLKPTQPGETMVRHAERVEAEIAAMEGEITGTDAVAAGTVRLTTVPIVANRILIPHLADLHDRFPLLRLELAADSRNLSLTRREADVALRLARPTGGHALARRIGRLDYAIYGPRRASAADLPWITYVDDMAGLPQARWLEAAARADGTALLVVNDAEAVLQAVCVGLGRSLLPCAVGDGEDRLRRLSGTEPVLSRDVWLLVHPELRRLARVAAVIGWLEGVIETVGRERLPRRSSGKLGVDPGCR